MDFVWGQATQIIKFQFRGIAIAAVVLMVCYILYLNNFISRTRSVSFAIGVAFILSAAYFFSKLNSETFSIFVAFRVLSALGVLALFLISAASLFDSSYFRMALAKPVWSTHPILMFLFISLKSSMIYSILLFKEPIAIFHIGKK